MSTNNQYTPLLNAGGAQQPSRGRRGRSGGVAGATLKKAGLVDEDSGMRDISAAGPSRGARGRGQGSMEADKMTGQDSRSARVRARANPLGSRPARGSQDPSVSGQAFGIRGAGRGREGRAQNGKGPVAVADLMRNGRGPGSKGKGRMPGGDGPDSLAARIQGGGGAHGHASSQQSQQSTTGKTISVLKQFLKARFAADAQFLNLEAMATDHILVRENIRAPGTPGAHKDIGSVMWKLCKELFPSIQTISLAKNDLKSLVPVSTLPDFLPNLRNLSLQENDIKWVRDLTFHQARSRGSTAKFSNLQELILIGNPVHANAVSAGNEQGYRAEVLARFPTLTMLDQQPITPTEQGFAQLPGGNAAHKKDQVGIAQGAANAGVEVRPFPLSILHGNFVDEHAEGIVPPFLAKFFQFFDTNRDSLRAAYTSDATFTIVTSSPVPPRARWSAYIHKLPRQKDLQWKSYRDVTSHNVMQLGVRPASKGFPRGPGAIIATLNKLPKTTHPLSDPSKFAFDAWLLPNAAIQASMSGSDGVTTKPDALIFINVHGEFAEAPSQGVRSFSRTFLVAPVVPGSQAANLGWPCVILSDQLTVRQYAGTDAWNTEAAAAAAPPASLPAAQAPATASSVPNAGALPPHLQNVAPAPGLSPEQHSLSLQLASQTGLTYPFAVQCLSENGWNPQLALQQFQSLKAGGSIPPQAFAVAM